MTPTYDKVHNRFKFNGLNFSHEDLKEVAYSLIKEGEPYEKVTGSFLIDWLNNDDYLYVKTSGSTGQPKNIKLMKQAMVNSAIATGNFFGLEPGDTALHCLPSHFIAGKMMFVRALVLGLELDFVEPTAHPIFDYEKTYDFCAMIPLQVKHTIGYLNNVKTIIVGGSKVTRPLLEKIKDLQPKFYETYGMTETVTHVAIRQLESKSAQREPLFQALENIHFTQDDRSCLIIHAPKLVDEPLITNDIVDLKSDRSFKLYGRFDNVVNSGGVKLFPEQIEDKLQPIIKERFIVASEEDASLGEKLILIIEKPSTDLEVFKKEIESLATLDKFEIPKKIYSVDQFAETVNGKIQRKKTIKSVIG
ncbi:O-succinylbenzoic acid--CoA ligase [Winogradskyella epiphytica]|uniref:O-succinylbenzoic acid--CoA ligase n=1 Tax=Winogradskyella epiphytica TaxID=262005 RepID=A0A2V4XET4_9FLAO|nr:AMP-binding protein [Winogradskyella epiphytica]PYE81565.1 O-succinylbenzoic acid--CoA ligase [Winogradskyella epiphytica]GGW64228.1 O-succinylbenzoic acid--CoA ligase [Winogradskyella epiphytica]